MFAGYGGASFALKKAGIPKVLFDFRIRKLTPKECFRLMGFLDDEVNLEGLSNTQRYKLAGNGWDVHLVSLIFSCFFLFLLKFSCHF